MSEITPSEFNLTNPPLLVYPHGVDIIPTDIFDGDFSVGRISGLNFTIEYFYKGSTYTKKVDHTIEIVNWSG